MSEASWAPSQADSVLCRSYAGHHGSYEVVSTGALSCLEGNISPSSGSSTLTHTPSTSYQWCFFKLGFFLVGRVGSLRAMLYLPRIWRILSRMIRSLASPPVNRYLCTNVRFSTWSCCSGNRREVYYSKCLHQKIINFSGYGKHTPLVLAFGKWR